MHQLILSVLENEEGWGCRMKIVAVKIRLFNDSGLEKEAY